MNKKLSIIIPTYKPKFLKEVLISLVCNYGYNPKTIEIIVVENPEITNITKDIITEVIKNHGGEIVHISSEKGANKARNAGIKYSSGEIIGLLDDDCITDRNWTSAVLAAHLLHPNLGIAGGCMKLTFRQKKPRWIDGLFFSNLAHVDMGISLVDLSNIQNRYDGLIVSGNMSFRRYIYDTTNGFDEVMGYIGKDTLMGHDEISFIHECMKLGSPRRLYVGNAIVFHQVPSERMTKEYFIRKNYADGFQFARLVSRDKINQDKKYEDLVTEYLLTYWDGYLTHHDMTLIRSQMAHEESMRIYLSVLMKCKSEFVRGFMDCLDNTNVEHYMIKTDIIDQTSGL